jgi:hypothetical protein
MANESVPKYTPPRYLMLSFISARGASVSIVLCALAGIWGLAWATASGSWTLAVAVVIGAALVSGLLLSYVEIVRIILDTLVPR